VGLKTYLGQSGVSYIYILRWLSWPSYYVCSTVNRRKDAKSYNCLRATSDVWLPPCATINQDRQLHWRKCSIFFLKDREILLLLSPPLSNAQVKLHTCLNGIIIVIPFVVVPCQAMLSYLANKKSLFFLFCFDSFWFGLIVIFTLMLFPHHMF